MGILRNCGIDFQVGGGHSSHEQPVFGVADPQPAPVCGLVSVDEVLLPERVRGRGLMGGDGELRILNRLHCQKDLAEESPGRLTGVGRHLENGQVEERREEPDPNRAPAQGVETQPAAFRPAAQEEQRLRGVCPQEVPVDRGLAGSLGLGDALVGDGDGFVAPAQQIQDGGQVGVDAEQVVQTAELGRLVARLSQLPHRRLGILAPGVGHGEGAGRV